MSDEGVWTCIDERSDGRVLTDGVRVKRLMHETSRSVHALLNHFEKNGLPGVPRFLGTDGDWELLSFIPGDPIKRPWSDAAFRVGLLDSLPLGNPFRSNQVAKCSSPHKSGAISNSTLCRPLPE